jgi:hypothetical protein
MRRERRHPVEHVIGSEAPAEKVVNCPFGVACCKPSLRLRNCRAISRPALAEHEGRFKQNERGDKGWRIDRKLQRNQPAKGVADHMRARDAEVCEQFAAVGRMDRNG